VALRNAAHISHRTLTAAADTGDRRLSRRELRRLAHGRTVRLAHAGNQARAASASKPKTHAAATTHRAPVRRFVQVRKRRV
jgi:hypothetical protein